MDYPQLEVLKKQGYHVLYRNREKDFYVPLKESYVSLLEKINETPLWEDEIIDITTAIENFSDYKEFLMFIKIVYLNADET